MARNSPRARRAEAYAVAVDAGDAGDGPGNWQRAMRAESSSGTVK